MVGGSGGGVGEQEINYWEMVRNCWLFNPRRGRRSEEEGGG